MITVNSSVLNTINSPVRQINAKAELYKGSALVNSFTHKDRLISITVERVGDETKFFGYSISQKVNIKLIDLERELSISTDNYFKVYFNSVDCLPAFYVTEVHRDEETNELSITAYDLIYGSSKHTIREVLEKLELIAVEEEGLPQVSYSMHNFARASAYVIGASDNVVLQGIEDTTYNFDLFYESGANYDGTESVRTALNQIAEASQTILYVNHLNQLVFKRLDLSGPAVLSIDKSKYITLDNGDNRRLSAVCSATELGDNVIASLDVTGSTQYIRDNAFWDLRDDINTIVEAALDAVAGLTINQFECNWRGNFLLELGDKIALTTKDDDVVFSYLLDDVISYEGFYEQKTQWSYSDNDEETADNPSTIGDAIKQTYAKVDKANRQIDLVASESNSNSAAIAALQINTESISASVQEIEKHTNEMIDGVNGEIDELKKKVDLKVTADDVSIQIQKELETGVETVTTRTGFTFDDEGLKIDKSDSEMSTMITEDGMTVYRNDEAVLVANNVGVDAKNLHATTYLWIGKNSRFEDYDDVRTGCFWVGGE